MATYCTTCNRGSWACNCGLSFAARAKGFQVSYSGFESRELKNYYDSEAIRDQFGEDSEERYLEETKGKDMKYLMSGPEYVVNPEELHG